MKTRRIVKLGGCSIGEWIVVKDDTQKENPFRVYHVWREPGEYGMKQRKRQMVRYGDLASCMYYLYDVVAKLQEGELLCGN